MTRAPGVEEAAGRSPLVGDALETARSAHAGQLRDEDPAMPFIDHPLAVAERVSQHGASDEVIAAALLHDVLEHSDLPLEQIGERFGEEVAGLVEALTENEEIEAYETRKREHRERVAASGADARTIYAADKLANVEVLREAYATKGKGAADGLPVPLDRKVEVWEADLEMLSTASPDDPLVRRFAGELSGLRRERAAEARGASR